MSYYAKLSLKDDQSQTFFLWTAASVAAAAAAVNPDSIKVLLANNLSIFPFEDNSVFNNVPKAIPKSLPDCPILGNWFLIILY